MSRLRTPNVVEREVHLSAPPARVWHHLVHAEELARWAAPEGAEVDLRVGGSVLLRGAGPVLRRARVVALDPPHVLELLHACVDPGIEPAEAQATLVRIDVRRRGAETRVHVLESGFADLDAPETRRAELAAQAGPAWTALLGKLAEHVAASEAALAEAARAEAAHSEAEGQEPNAAAQPS